MLLLELSTMFQFQNTRGVKGDLQAIITTGMKKNGAKMKEAEGENSLN